MKPDVAFILPLVLAVTLTGTQGTAPAPAPTIPVSMPDPVRKALDKQYKKWQMAVVTPAGSCQDRMGTSPAFVTGDFNGDGFPDYAAEITTSSGLRVVALMGYLQEYQMYELESTKDTIATRFLGIEKRGTKFINPRTSLEDYFGQDTLASYSCGKERVAYIWVGFNFQRAVLPELLRG